MTFAYCYICLLSLNLTLMAIFVLVFILVWISPRWLFGWLFFGSLLLSFTLFSWYFCFFLFEVYDPSFGWYGNTINLLQSPFTFSFPYFEIYFVFFLLLLFYILYSLFIILPRFFRKVKKEIREDLDRFYYESVELIQTEDKPLFVSFIRDSSFHIKKTVILTDDYFKLCYYVVWFAHAANLNVDSQFLETPEEETSLCLFVKLPQFGNVLSRKIYLDISIFNMEELSVFVNGYRYFLCVCPVKGRTYGTTMLHYSASFSRILDMKIVIDAAFPLYNEQFLAVHLDDVEIQRYNPFFSYFPKPFLCSQIMQASYINFRTELREGLRQEFVYILEDILFNSFDSICVQFQHNKDKNQNIKDFGNSLVLFMNLPDDCIIQTKPYLKIISKNVLEESTLYEYTFYRENERFIVALFFFRKLQFCKKVCKFIPVYIVKVSLRFLLKKKT
jgi:hypothetical protein